MEQYTSCIIKSFKHDGHLHRMWLQNWLLAPEMLHAEHRAENMIVLINSQTKIQESDGKHWVSKIPAVSFFIPGQWFNVVSLIEETGVRYYCNLASPPYRNGNIITYIDYDLDVIRLPAGEVHIVDQEEYATHKVNYHYSDVVDRKVQDGLRRLLSRIQNQQPPFQDSVVREYYYNWKKNEAGV